MPQGYFMCPHYYENRCAFDRADPPGAIDHCPGAGDPDPQTAVCPFSGHAHSQLPPPGSTARRMLDTEAWSAAGARCKAERAEAELLDGILARADSKPTAHLTHEGASAGPRPTEPRMWVKVEGAGWKWWPTSWFRRGVGNS